MSTKRVQGSVAQYILLVLVLFFCVVLSSNIVRSCSEDSMSALDSIRVKSQVVKSDLVDTIVKYDTVMLKADVVYRVTRDTLWKKSPDAVSVVFNNTFVRDSLDTTSYVAGYTQLRKAIDASNKNVRDSIKIDALISQIDECTSSVNEITEYIDSTVNTQQDGESDGWKPWAVVAGVATAIILLGLVGYGNGD